MTRRYTRFQVGERVRVNQQALLMFTPPPDNPRGTIVAISPSCYYVQLDAHIEAPFLCYELELERLEDELPHKPRRLSP